MRIAVAALLLALAAGIPSPEETAALLLSPDAEVRERGRAVLAAGPGRAYEREVIAIVGERAGARGEWIAELETRAEEAEGAELLKLQRMLDALHGACDAMIGVDAYFVAVPPVLARRILGEEGATVAHAAPGAWESWWRQILAEEGSEVLLRRALPTRDSRPASFKNVRETSYVKEYARQEKGTSVLLDPVVATVEAGLSMSWRPHLSDDREFVTLDCRIVVSELVQPMKTAAVVIDGQTVQIQVPEVRKLEVSRSVTLPVGGHVAWRIPGPGAGDDARVVLVLLRAVLGDPLPVEGPPSGEPRADAGTRR